jgi:hypothetical protein
MDQKLEVDKRLVERIEKLRNDMAVLYGIDPEKILGSEENMKKLAAVENTKMRAVIRVYEGILLDYYK